MREKELLMEVFQHNVILERTSILVLSCARNQVYWDWRMVVCPDPLVPNVFGNSGVTSVFSVNRETFSV